MTTAVIYYVSSMRQLEKQVISSNQNVLNQISKRVDHTLQEIDLTMLNFLRTNDSHTFFENSASNDSEYLLSISTLQDRMGSILGSNFNMKSILLYSKRSGKLVTAADYYDLQDVPEKTWVKSLSESNQTAKWTSTPLNNDVLLVRHYPFTARARDSTGVIITQINEKSISSMFADLQFNDSYNVFLIDREGTILSHKDPTLIHQTIIDKSYSSSILSQEGAGYMTEKTSSGRQYVFYNHSGYSGWTLVYIVSQQQLSALSETVRNILIGLACFMVILAIIVTRFVNHRWFTPMEHFVVKLEEITTRHTSPVSNHSLSTDASYTDLHNKIQQVFTGYSDAERKLHESIPALKLQMMFDMLTGNRTKFTAAEPLLKHVGIKLFPANYIVMTMEFDNKAVMQNVGDHNLYLYALCNVAEETVHDHYDGVRGAAVQMNDYQAVMILSFASENTAENAATSLRFGELLKSYIKDHFKRTICIGIGTHYTDFPEIHTSYRESATFISFKILTGPNTLITSDNVRGWNSQSLLEVFETVDELIEAVKQVNGSSTELLLNELFDRVAACKLSKDTVVQLCLQVILKALRATANTELHEQFQEEQDSILFQLHNCESLQEMHTELGILLTGLLRALDKKRSNRKKTNELIEAILAYVHVHYAQSDLSVNYLADLFGISPNYLSKLFKEYTFSNFVDCLMDIRMKAAHSLLLETTLTLNEVAWQIGYTNFSSFLRNFKKYYGMTPTAYRQVYK